MATKTPTSKRMTEKAIRQPPRKEVIVKNSRDCTTETYRRNFANMAMSPEVAALRVLENMETRGGAKSAWDETDTPTVVELLQEQAKAASGGDLTHAEAMLMNQAVALQSLFAGLTEKALAQNHMPHIEGYLRMALRAQNQCRATLETLAAIKNPPVVFAKQANINHGNQQVNNGIPAPRTGENQNAQNELLEADYGSKTLDTRATSRAGRKDQAMATVGA